MCSTRSNKQGFVNGWISISKQDNVAESKKIEKSEQNNNLKDVGVKWNLGWNFEKQKVNGKSNCQKTQFCAQIINYKYYRQNPRHL